METPATVNLLNAIMVAIPATIFALAALVTSLRNGRKADIASVKQDAIVQKTDEIHVNTNGTLSQMRDDVARSLQEIEQLKLLIADLISDHKAACEAARLSNISPRP